MARHAQTPLTVFQRRRSRRLAHWNGALWAIGNGLTSSTLVIYLALELDAPAIGLGIGFIKAAPQFAGVLRLGTPALIGRLGDRRRLALGAYFFSALALFGLPLAAAPGLLPSATASLTMLVVLWCVYHLLEYVATVALWSWFADLVPLRIRGRFIGQRQRWMTSGQAVAMLTAGLGTWGWHSLHPELPRWIGYAIPATAGACFMIAALVPLSRISALASGEGPSLRAVLRSMRAPFGDRRFLRLLLFGCWFSFFNGVTLSAQSIFPYRVLGFSMFVMLALETGMRCGQLTVSPWFGRMADRFGNRGVMIATLPLVASGPLFYFLAGPERPWWIAGAWVVWIFYAGLNVALPNLMLKLSPRESGTAYIASYFAVTGLCFAVSTIVGGLLFDLLGNRPLVLSEGGFVLDFYHYSFLFGWITRTLGVVLLLFIIEDNLPRPGDR